MERTLIILKPDAVKRKLMGEIISRIERKNFEITAMKMMRISKAVAEEHYFHVKDIPVYDDMINFIISGSSVVLIVTGNNIIQAVRNMIGKTNTLEAAPGTIRGDYGSHRYENLVHASDSAENAEIEIRRFFTEND